MTFRTRFAPSPTGPLHLGHAFSAMLAYDMAQAHNGQFLLRLEDIDQSRARSAWETKIFEDLTWLGLDWSQPVLRQSSNMKAYQDALKQLQKMDVVYNCYCARKDILAAASAPQEGVLPPSGPDGLVYPGTCRDKTTPPESGMVPAIRLNMRKAINMITSRVRREPPGFLETGDGIERHVSVDAREAIDNIGDVVLVRRDLGTSYHLSVVVDDAAQEITHVIRGEDLFDATKIHVVLQNLLSLPSPIYVHHKLIRDDEGKRLAKRDDARAIAKYRDDGLSPRQIRRLVGLA